MLSTLISYYIQNAALYQLLKRKLTIPVETRADTLEKSPTVLFSDFLSFLFNYFFVSPFSVNSAWTWQNYPARIFRRAVSSSKFKSSVINIPFEIWMSFLEIVTWQLYFEHWDFLLLRHPVIVTSLLPIISLGYISKHPSRNFCPVVILQKCLLHRLCSVCGQ